MMVQPKQPFLHDRGGGGGVNFGSDLSDIVHEWSNGFPFVLMLISFYFRPPYLANVPREQLQRRGQHLERHPATHRPGTSSSPRPPFPERL